MTFKNEVFSLWIGPSLSIMEQTCINSFLQKHTAFILYTYSDISNVPYGTIVKDANTVILQEEYSKYDNPSFFSNLFRYTLLYELGGIWVDMDLVCIQPLNELFATSDYIFSSELKNNEQHTNAGIIGCPPKTQLMLDCYKEVKRIVQSNTSIRHGLLGPKVLKKYVSLHELDHYVHPSYVFCPYDFKEVHKIFSPSNITYKTLEEDILCIHLWNNVLTGKGIDKSMPLENSLYKEFITYHLPDKIFEYKHDKYEYIPEYAINISNKQLYIAYSEIEAFNLKKQIPSSNIILLKKSFNAFIISCNNVNTYIYAYIDKIILDKSITNADIKFNILKTLLKK